MPDADAILQAEGGRSVLRFERHLPHPPARVWEALTGPNELAAWHPSPFELEPRVGGLLSYITGESRPELPDGEVIEYEPPRLLAHTWGGDQLRWELRPGDGECLLILTHTFDDRLKAARDAAGWHLCLTALSTSLDHGQARTKPDGGRLPQGWRELNELYEKRFGIAPEQATPPPPAERARHLPGATDPLPSRTAKLHGFLAALGPQTAGQRRVVSPPNRGWGETRPRWLTKCRSAAARTR